MLSSSSQESPLTDELRIEYIPLSKLKRYPKNAKDHDLGLLHASISRFGFKDPMAIDEATGELVEGHGRLETLERQRIDGEPLPKHMKVVDGEWAAPVIRGITFDDDFERRAYTIAANRTTEMGGWHEELLTAELTVLAEREVAFEGLGYDLEDLDRMVADAAFRDAPPTEPEPEVTKKPATEDKAAPPKFGVLILTPDAEAEEDLVLAIEHHGVAGDCRVMRLSESARE
jgi:ParB-like chromosome segregation protein Spo0J